MEALEENKSVEHRPIGWNGNGSTVRPVYHRFAIDSVASLNIRGAQSERFENAITNIVLRARGNEKKEGVKCAGTRRLLEKFVNAREVGRQREKGRRWKFLSSTEQSARHEDRDRRHESREQGVSPHGISYA